MLGEWLLARPSRPELEETGGFQLDVGRVDVEVHPVLAGLGFRHALEQQLGAGLPIGRQK